MFEPSQRPQSQTDTWTPPFDETNVLENIVADTGGTHQGIIPEVNAKIGRGFFLSEGKWICYRRNYFAVTCSFTLHPWISGAPLSLHKIDGTLEHIRGFAMSVSAIVNGQYGETRELMQHYPKSDKKSKSNPGRVVLQPSPPILLAETTDNSSYASFALGSQSVEYNSSFTDTSQAYQPPTQHIFEGIQFQKATANNGKRRAQQQTYNLIVELQAEVVNPIDGKASWVNVARRQSDAIVVRGRSPGHYRDGRRDSTAKLGPDSSVSDVSGGAIPPGLGQAAQSHLLMDDPAQSLVAVDARTEISIFQQRSDEKGELPHWVRKVLEHQQQQINQLNTAFQQQAQQLAQLTTQHRVTSNNTEPTIIAKPPLPKFQDTEKFSGDVSLPGPFDNSLVGLAGHMFKAILRLYITITQRVAESNHSRRLRSELERFFLWGDGFSVLDGQLDAFLSKSSDLRQAVLSTLYELGRVVKDDLSRVVSAKIKLEESAESVLPDLTQSDMTRELQRLLKKAASFLAAAEVPTDFQRMEDDESTRYDMGEILDDVEVYIDCLMDLSLAIESPVVDLEPSDFSNQEFDYAHRITP